MTSVKDGENLNMHAKDGLLTNTGAHNSSKQIIRKMVNNTEGKYLICGHRNCLGT